MHTTIIKIIRKKSLHVHNFKGCALKGCAHIYAAFVELYFLLLAVAAAQFGLLQNKECVMSTEQAQV